MRNAVKISLVAMVILSAMLSSVVNASSGYFAHGYGTAEKGLAGAGTAYSQDALAAATNPAGMAFVGSRMDLGVALVNASPRGHTVTGTPLDPSSLTSPDVFGGAAVPLSGTCVAVFKSPDTLTCEPPFSVNPGVYESINELFLSPHFGRSWQLNDATVIGFSMYGNGGLSTEYTNGTATTVEEVDPDVYHLVDDLPGTLGAGETGMALEQIFFNLSYAKKLNNTDAIGVSLIIAAQRFAAEGLGKFESFSLAPEKITSNQHDYSYGGGLKIGYQGDIVDGVRFGASYQSKLKMSKFDEYAGLFANHGEFDVPSTFNIGLAVDTGETGMIMLDVQRINYTDVAALSNPISSLRDGSCTDELKASLAASDAAGAIRRSDAFGEGCLGGANGAGFGWQDVTVVKLGYQIDVGDMTYRIGYSHTGEVIPESEVLFNILAPATIEHHLTAGLTVRIGQDQEFNVSGMVAPKSTVKGGNPFDVDNATGISRTEIEIELFQWELQAGWAWKY